MNTAIQVRPQSLRPALRLVKTNTLSRDEWLEVRKHGIGSSDAAAAVGVKGRPNFQWVSITPALTLTVFKVPDFARKELLSLASGQPIKIKPSIEKLDDAQLDDPLKNLSDIAFERIKDQINRLDWEEMQELVAGVTRHGLQNTCIPCWLRSG